MSFSLEIFWEIAWDVVGGYIRGTGAAEAADVMTRPVSVGNWSMATMELLSAQPVMDPWVVRAAVVVPQSHCSLAPP